MHFISVSSAALCCHVTVYEIVNLCLRKHAINFKKRITVISATKNHQKWWFQRQKIIKNGDFSDKIAQIFSAGLCPAPRQGFRPGHIKKSLFTVPAFFGAPIGSTTVWCVVFPSSAFWVDCARRLRCPFIWKAMWSPTWAIRIHCIWSKDWYGPYPLYLVEIQWIQYVLYLNVSVLEADTEWIHCIIQQIHCIAHVGLALSLPICRYSVSFVF